MNLPIIFCIDDDIHVLNALTRDLKKKYRNTYRIYGTISIDDALSNLLKLKNRGETVAMFISDQRMPLMDGVMFLGEGMKYYPDAKKVLLTAYSDTNAAIKAINRIQLDYYLIKPWDPPEEKLYPVIDGLLEDWSINEAPDFRGIKIIGHQHSHQCYKIKDFLSGNLVPYQWLDTQISEVGQNLLSLNRLHKTDVPVVFFEDGSYLVRPSILEIAEKIGLTPQLKDELYDVIIIGAGPAGLAAGVYGASEGLKTLMIEKHAPGGQAGTSSRIENYLGFPAGLSGAELTHRALTQATRLGTEFLSPQCVQTIEQLGNYKRVVLESGKHINTRSIVITTGVDYHKLDTKGVADFIGAGVYYGSAKSETSSCREKEIFIVGGGNSAGQAAVYLSKFAKKVHMLIRREDLSATMSAYLIAQINEIGNIEIMPGTEIVEARGKDKLEELVIRNINTCELNTFEAVGLYIFIGAKPFTDWIPECILKDEKGFIETGRELKHYQKFKTLWKQARDPYLLETSCPGVFAAGDVITNAMNRVASAVGAGSMAISFVHKYLAEVK